MKKVLILLAILTVVSALFQNTYKNLCGAASCKCKRHIDCDNHNMTKSKSCAKDSRVLNTKKIFVQKHILDKHNSFRNYVAGGQLPGFKPASRMGTIAWDNYLASLAMENVLLCRFQGDKCRNTHDFHFVGQLMGRYDYPKGLYNSKSMLLHIIDIWMKQHEYCKMSYIEKYPRQTQDGYVIRHFAQTVREAVRYVGCAALLYNVRDRGYFEFVCNYSQTNLLGLPVYTPGETAKGCKTGRNKKFTNLCSIKEEYNSNPEGAVAAD